MSETEQPEVCGDVSCTGDAPGAVPEEDMTAVVPSPTCAVREYVPVEEEGADVPPAVPSSAEETDESTLGIDAAVVEKIVAITCRSVDGILQMKGNLLSSLQEGFGGTDVKKGVSVEMVGDDACNVSVSIIMEYGKSATKIFQELHDRISEKITDMTGLKVGSVNVRITDVATREEMEGGRRREKGTAAAGRASSAN